jgi:hypothetical protein
MAFAAILVAGIRRNAPTALNAVRKISRPVKFLVLRSARDEGTRTWRSFDTSVDDPAASMRPMSLRRQSTADAPAIRVPA